MAAIVKRAGGFEKRSVTWSLSGYQNVGMTGVIPPHGWDYQSDAGVALTERSVTQLSPVNRCLSIIARYIVNLGDPLPYTTAYDPTTNLPYTKYIAPIPEVLTNTWGLLPDGRPRSQSEGISATVYSLALFNEAIWLTVTRDDLGNPSALTPLHPAFVEIKSDASGFPLYSYGAPGKGSIPLDPADITHLRLDARPGTLRGVSSLVSASLGYGMLLAALKYGLKFFGQGASPSFLLTTEGTLSQEQTERIMAKLMIEHSGLDMAHLPLILTNGLKAEKIGTTPDEAQFIGTLLHASNDVADYFGVPNVWISSSGSNTLWGKTAQEVRQTFLDATLSGYVVPLNEAFSSLLPRGQSAMLNTRPLLRGNSADTAKEVQALRTATVLTENEIRMNYYNLPPLPGGDDLHAPLASNVAAPAQESNEPEADTEE